MKIYDVLWRREKNDGRAIWKKVGVLFEKEDGRMSIKLDLIPSSGWDGYLVVSEKQPKEEASF